MMNFGLKGRVVAVTGAASGIGRATAQLLAADGARVAALDVSENGLAETVSMVRGSGGDIHAIHADVRSDESLAHAAAEAEKALGPVDGLVAAAGVHGAGRSEDLDAAEIERVYAVNAVGLFLSCKAFARHMLRRGRGNIVAIGSLSGLHGQSGRLAYTSSKWAVHGMVRTLAVEWSHRGVRINAIAPTFVDTPLLWSAIVPDYMNEMLDRTPMGRGAKPQDIAAPVAFLLSDAAALISGVVIPVDGGLTAGYMTRRNGADYGSVRMRDAGLYSVD